MHVSFANLAQDFQVTDYEEMSLYLNIVNNKILWNDVIDSSSDGRNVKQMNQAINDFFLPSASIYINLEIITTMFGLEVDCLFQCCTLLLLAGLHKTAGLFLRKNYW